MSQHHHRRNARAEARCRAAMAALFPLAPAGHRYAGVEGCLPEERGGDVRYPASASISRGSPPELARAVAEVCGPFRADTGDAYASAFEALADALDRQILAFARRCAVRLLDARPEDTLARVDLTRAGEGLVRVAVLGPAGCGEVGGEGATLAEAVEALARRCGVEGADREARRDAALEDAAREEGAAS